MQTLEEEYFRQQTISFVSNCDPRSWHFIMQMFMFLSDSSNKSKIQQGASAVSFLGQLLNHTEKHCAFVLILIIKPPITEFFYSKLV